MVEGTAPLRFLSPFEALPPPSGGGAKGKFFSTIRKDQLVIVKGAFKIKSYRPLQNLFSQGNLNAKIKCFVSKKRKEKMILTKFQYLLKSRKFWAAVLAALTSVIAFFMDEITAWQLVQALVAVAASYSTGVAIEDAGRSSSHA